MSISKEVQESLNFSVLCISLSFVDNYYIINDSDDSYCGSDTNVTYQNLAGEFASKALGFDVCEDDYWAGYTNKATSREINDFAISNMMKLISPYFSDIEKLYIFNSEDCPVNKMKCGSIDDIKASGLYSEDEVERINSFNPNDCNISDSFFNFNSSRLVFRIA